MPVLSRLHEQETDWPLTIVDEGNREKENVRRTTSDCIGKVTIDGSVFKLKQRKESTMIVHSLKENQY